jgi:CDP-diacylglycerol--glycerol-3-phosphate 3-phosphatidyltransferase
VLFLRNLLIQRGVTQGARTGGKIKALFYMLSGILSLAVVSLKRLTVWEGTPYIHYAAIAVFVIAMIVSLASFFDYYMVYKKVKEGTSGTL